jgi:MFS family permease
MLGLRRAGLIIAILPVPFLLIYAVSQGLNEYYGFYDNLLVAFMYGMPCLLVAAVSWRWPRRGGAIAILVALLLLVFSTISIIASKSPDPVLQRTVLTFTEIATFIVPYAMLLVGCALAFIPVWKFSVRDFRPRTAWRTVRDNKLAKAGLWIMLLPGIIVILTFIIAIGLGGDMIPSMNFFAGFLMGSMLGGLPLLLAIAAWRWPLRGGAIAAGLSIIGMLVSGLLWLLFAEYPNPLALTLLVLLTLSLVGGLMVFFSAKRTGCTSKDFSD